MNIEAHQLTSRDRSSSAWTYPVILLLAALAAYANHFDGVFLMDDLSNIVENPTMKFAGGFAQNWRELFAHGRPLVFFSLLIDFTLWGLSPVGFHIFNLAVHMVAGLAAYGFLATTFTKSPVFSERFRENGRLLAFVSTLIWVLHPLNTQSVTYIVQRAESLMGLFFLVTMFATAKIFSLQGDPGARRALRRWQWVAIVAAVLSVATKQVGVTVPIIVLASQWIFWAPREDGRGSFLRGLKAQKSLYLGLSATFAAAALLVMLPTLDPNSGFQYKGITPWDYFKTQPGVLLHYIRLFFWPGTLVLDYGWPVAASLKMIIVPGLIVTALAVGTILAFIKQKPIGFVGVWFFVVLAPSSSFLPIKDLAFEHRMYLPALALAAGLVAYGWLLASRLNVERTAIAAAAIIAVALGIRTHVRNYDYRSPVTMWSKVISARPENPRAFNELGNALMQNGRGSDALELFKKALALEPNNPGPLLNISNILQSANQLDDALAILKKATDMKPDFAAAWFNLGNVYIAKKDQPNAEAAYRKALEIDPKYAEAFVGLGNALAIANNYDSAIEQYHKALAVRPWLSQPYNNIGTIYSQMKKHEDALKAYVDAINLQPSDTSIRVNLANTLVDLGNVDQAREQYGLTLRMAPEHPGAVAGLNRIAAITKQKAPDKAPENAPPPALSPIPPSGN